MELVILVSLGQPDDLRDQNQIELVIEVTSRNIKMKDSNRESS